MMKCTVCGAANDELAIVCIQCKSYLQTKVDNLDLFQTSWQLMESPRRAMRRIVLARHKNFVLPLAALLGTSVVFSVFWYRNLGPRFPDFLTLVGSGLVAGLPAGILLAAILSIVLVLSGRLLGGKGTFRNAFAVIAYGGLPVVLSLLLVFPIELALFGGYLFDNNPSPLVINAAAYVTLMVLDGAAILWSITLLFHGVVTLHTITSGKAMVVTGVVLLVLTGMLTLGTARL